MRAWAKVGIFFPLLVWAQEYIPTRLVVYDELIDRFFHITHWSLSGQTARPDTILYLKVAENVPPLHRFPNLQALYLSGVEELDLDALVKEIKKYCPKLRALALEDCEIVDISPLAQLNLQGLLLDQNPITDFSPLSRFKNLQFISLAHTGIRDVSVLGQIPTLQAIDLSETPVADLSPLRTLSRLRMLVLFRCRELKDLTPLPNFTNLELLNISHIHHSVAKDILFQISRLSNLRVLQAQGVIQDVAILAAIGTLTQLEELTIGQNPAIQDLSFVRLLRRLLYLDVHHSSVRDLSPLAGLPNLVKLSIGKNQITSLAPLRQCPKLSYLYCYENPIQDWEKLLEIPSLSYVMLSRNDLPPERLKSLKAQLQWKGIKVDIP